MEVTTAEVSQADGSSPDVRADQSENTVSDHVNNDFREEEPKLNMNSEEIREIMEVIAATGKFWHEWDTLKSFLSFRLKQALAEYSESQMDSGIGSQQGSIPGETYAELVTRLDEALLSFTEGPPFTLQRLCEILLAPRSIYPKLSKLALALEKAYSTENLLVTSTLTRCTDPYPVPGAEKQPEPGVSGKQAQEPSHPVLAGAENSAGGDGDEEMAEAETEEANTDKRQKIEEERVGEGSGSGNDEN
ncbi:hypothetical protein Taro_009340 [Colocasia esculenta]|uniref:Serine/threonine-protein phosphatase 4 regulatory subunit 2 n=1 Tax=Colocasia esculenta TaxID=4460 RepID=A0A843U9M9_COLES|nr:hypothetical protein [Colocasia esculenta]